MLETEYVEYPKQNRYSPTAKYGVILSNLLSIAVLGYIAAIVVGGFAILSDSFGISFVFPNDLMLAETVSIISKLVGLIAFCAMAIWLYRSYRNLTPLGAGKLYYSPKWAYLGFLVPIANLFVPYLLMADTWRVSQAATEQESCATAWEHLSIPNQIQIWWFSHLIGAIAVPISEAIFLPAGGDYSSTQVTVFPLLSSCVALVWSLFSIKIIKSIETTQTIAYEKQPLKNFCTRKAICPECGHELRTRKAKQCPSCFLGWHDPYNPKRSGEPTSVQTVHTTSRSQST